MWVDEYSRKNTSVAARHITYIFGQLENARETRAIMKNILVEQPTAYALPSERDE